MTQATIEDRLERLESLVESLLQRLSREKPRHKDWRRTVGMFDSDAIMKEVIVEAQRLREEERKSYYAMHDRQIKES